MGSNNIHALKHVQFFGREVPIVLQNENGPCPLLALANVLSLRNQIRLPMKSKHIDQERLVAIVADFLVEANTFTDGNVPEDYKANLQQNLSDVMMVLPKLTTGIDVNVRFDDIKGFEFTDEIAIFDLLGISLVHGWLYDTEDKLTAKVIDRKTYNEIVWQIVTMLGTPALSEALSPQASRVTGLEGFTPTPNTSKRSLGGSLLDPEEEKQLKMAFALSLGHVPESEGEVQEIVRAMVTAIFERVKAAAVSAATGPATAAAFTATSPLATAVGDAQAGGLEATTSGLSDASDPPQEDARLLGEADVTELPPVLVPRGPGNSSEGQQSPVGANLQDEEPSTVEASSADKNKEQSTQTLQKIEEAHISKNFLEQSSSQLTQFGLDQLRQGLKNHELAVFFRNNHFNTLFFYKNELYILVTDFGYMWEADLVWEHLSSVDGDTSFVKGDFTRFAKAIVDDEVNAAAGLVQAAFSEPAPSSEHNEDVDYALALQLQTEEEGRQKLQLQRQKELQAKKAQAAQATPTKPAPARLETQPQPVRPRPTERTTERTTASMFRRKTSDKSKDCVLM